MQVVIKKNPTPDGTSYEIEDFNVYVRELERKGIVSPKAKYRILISTATAHDIGISGADIETQVALFFRLGEASGISYIFSPLEAPVDA